jgi:hypothetical protein
LPEPTRVFQSPNIDNARISKIIEQDSIVKIGSVLQGEMVGHTDAWVWCEDGIGFIPGTWCNSTYYWNNSQWTYYLQQSYRPMEIDGNLLLVDNTQYIDPEQVVRRIGGDELHTRYLVWLYWHYSRITQVNPLLPIAQSLLETGNFTSYFFTKFNNPAGIGFTGDVRIEKPRYGTWVWDSRVRRYREGIAFDTIESGIKAHIGRLLAYWFKTDEKVTPTQQSLIQYALLYRTVPIGIRGSLKHGIQALEGTWALDSMYTNKLLRKLRWLVGE